MLLNKFLFRASLLFLLLCLILAGLPAGDARAQSSTVLKVSPPESQVSAGSTTTISLEVAAGVDVNAFDLTLRYDPALLSLESWSTGPYLSNLALVYQVNEAGRIRLVYTQLATPGVSGDGVLLQFVFRGLAEGESALTLEEVDFSSPSGQLSHPALENGLLHVVAAPAASPTPTATATHLPTATTRAPSATASPTAAAIQPSATPAAPTATALVPLATDLQPTAAGQTPQPLASQPAPTDLAAQTTTLQPALASPTPQQFNPTPSPTELPIGAGFPIQPGSSTPNLMEMLFAAILILGGIMIFCMVLIIIFRRRQKAKS